MATGTKRVGGQIGVKYGTRHPQGLTWCVQQTDMKTCAINNVNVIHTRGHDGFDRCHFSVTRNQVRPDPLRYTS